MQPYIISIDPGVTTGVVIARDLDFDKETYTISAYEVAWAARKNLYTTLQELGPKALYALVIEDFRLYADKAKDQINSDFPAVKMIERVTVYAEMLGVEARIVMQGAALRQSVQINPAHYQALRRSKHTQAAYKHLRYFFLSEARKIKALKRRS